MILGFSRRMFAAAGCDEKLPAFLRGHEVASKQEKNISVRTSMAKFSYVKTLEIFDFLFQQPKLLIIDEIGYIPINRHGAHLYFQLVSRRYMRRAP